jgi:chromosome segregation ATPase
MEVESRQLHQVISQLRQSRRVEKVNVDEALAERDSQKDIIESQAKEISVLRKEVFALSQQRTTDVAQITEMSDELTRIALSRDNIQNRVNECERLLEERDRETGKLLRENYELQSQYAACSSDLLIAQHDLNECSAELENMKIAVRNIEKEYEQKQRRLEQTYRDKNEAIKQEWIARLESERELFEESKSDLKTQLAEALRARDEEVLLRRKLDMEVAEEKRKMNVALERAIEQLNNSREDTVDRALVKNLLVSYFERHR